MKGGFQILDLSGLTVGTEAAVNNAFKTAEGFNNKAILVLPPSGGSVYCQLNKSSSNYVGAYVGADGATYNVVIKPNNNVTITKTEAVTESELTPITASIMSIGGQVENLQTDVNEIKNYYTDGGTMLENNEPTVITADGFISLERPRGSGNSGKTSVLGFKNKNQNTYMAIACLVGLGSGDDDYEYVTIPVKKGQTVRWVYNGTGSSSCAAQYFKYIS